jgi:hypothetical protein
MLGFFEEGFCFFEEGFCDFGFPPDRGVVLVMVLVWVVVPVLVGVEFVGVEVTGAHDSETPTTPEWTGNEIWDNGVPGATFTVNDKCPPPTKVTVMTHSSAEAEGSAAIPRTTSIEAAVTAPSKSFRLLSTVAYLLPRSAGARRQRRDHAAACEGRYWVTPRFATVNCPIRAGSQLSVCAMRSPVGEATPRFRLIDRRSAEL